MLRSQVLQYVSQSSGLPDALSRQLVCQPVDLFADQSVTNFKRNKHANMLVKMIIKITILKTILNNIRLISKEQQNIYLLQIGQDDLAAFGHGGLSLKARYTIFRFFFWPDFITFETKWNNKQRKQSLNSNSNIIFNALRIQNSNEKKNTNNLMRIFEFDDHLQYTDIKINRQIQCCLSLLGHCGRFAVYFGIIFTIVTTQFLVFFQN